VVLRWLTIVSGVGFWLSALGVCVITLLITADVFLRMLGHPIMGAFELTEIIMTVTVFASLAYTQREKGHIHVTMFIARLPLRARLFVFGLMSVIATAVIGYIAYAAFSQAGKVVENGHSSSVLEIPLYPFYYIEGVAMALFMLVLLLDAAKAFIGMWDDDVAHDVIKHWD
jgi:TRAP-type C4-dicarboxylate transport system permease small subunit